MSMQSRRRIRRPDCDLPPQVHIRGQLMEYLSGRAFSPPPAGDRRGDISSFSRSARLRLVKALLAIDYTLIPTSVCITVTYPDERLPRDMHIRQMDRSQLIRHIEDHLGRQVCGLWRTEWVPRLSGIHRGHLAPHLHMVLMGVRYIPYEAINRWWMQCIQYDGYVRTEIKRARKQKTTMYYISKYISKSVDSSLVYASYVNKADGKHYDWIRRRLIPTHPHEWIGDLTQEQIDYVYDAHLMTWPESETRRGESCTIMGESVRRISEILRTMG